MSSCFGPIFGGFHQGPITSTGPAFFNPTSWAWESGPARLFFKPNQYRIYIITMSIKIKKNYHALKNNIIFFDTFHLNC